MFASRRFTLTAACLALIGAAAPLASAQPWFRVSIGNGWPARAPRQHVIVRQPPVIVVPAPVIVRRVETIPSDLRFAAYQTRDTVILVVNGTNMSGGFETCLSSRDVHDATPTITLRNTSPAQCGVQCLAPFEVSASFRARDCIRSIEVRVADRCFQVPVSQVQPLLS